MALMLSVFHLHLEGGGFRKIFCVGLMKRLLDLARLASSTQAIEDRLFWTYAA